MTPEQEKAIARAKAIAKAVFSRDTAASKPIATTPDGGEVYRMPSGQLSFKSPGYATNDQERIKRIMEGATVKQEVQTGFDQDILRQAPARARVQEFAQGAPLVGEWFDEAIQGVNPEKARNSRILSDAMERQNPVESAGLNILGGVVTSAPALMAGAGAGAANFVGRGASRLTQAGRAALAAAPVGAVEGASTFAGRAPEGQRGQAAATGALVGGGLSATLGVIAPLLGEGVASIARRVKKLDVDAIAKEFSVSKPAARVVKGYLANDDLAAASNILARGGDDAMLAEAGPATRQALDTAMSVGGEALSTARPRVDARVQGAAANWAKTVDDILGDASGGIKGAAKDISRRTAATRKAAYDFAYRQPAPTVGQAANDIQDALSRISPRTMQSAVAKANDRMRADGLVNRNIMASIDDATGEVTFSQPLNIMQMDYIKRALGDLAEDGTDKMTGKMSSDAALAARLGGQLGDALKEHIPGYARAMKLGGDTIRDTNALVMGRKLLSQSTTVEDVRNAMKSASVTERAAAKKGLRENLDAIMGQARATIADLEAGNVDFQTGQNAVGEAVAAIRNLTSKNNQVKTRLVLGGKADTLFKELEKMGDALVLRSAVARNSATAIRQAGQDAMRAEVTPNLALRTAGNAGNPLDAAKEITQTITGIDARTLSDVEARYFAEIADALTRIKGDAAKQALAAVQKAMNGQPIKEEQAKLIGRLVAGSTAVGAYQAGKRPLSPQPQ